MEWTDAEKHEWARVLALPTMQEFARRLEEVRASACDVRALPRPAQLEDVATAVAKADTLEMALRILRAPWE